MRSETSLKIVQYFFSCARHRHRRRRRGPLLLDPGLAPWPHGAYTPSQTLHIQLYSRDPPGSRSSRTPRTYARPSFELCSKQPRERYPRCCIIVEHYFSPGDAWDLEICGDLGEEQGELHSRGTESSCQFFLPFYLSCFSKFHFFFFFSKSLLSLFLPIISIVANLSLSRKKNFNQHALPPLFFL